MLHFETYYPWLIHSFRIVMVLGLAFLAVRVLKRLIPRLRQHTVNVMQQHAGGNRIELEKRAATIAGIIRKAATVLIWAVASMTALKEIGFDVAPLLAGAGVVGLAVGFGAQNLVRDVITGFFMIIENQIRVNDVAVINGTGGLVEEINLRTTVLRSMDGAVHVFPNGTITSLTNMTREFSYYVFDIGVAYKEDTDRVCAVVKEEADLLMQEPEWAPLILEPIETLGVDQFADSAVILKMRIKTQPIQQWKVGRELNRRIKKKFDEVGIEIPFPHTSLYFGEAGKPLKLQLEAPNRDELKLIVREVVLELEKNRSGSPGKSEPTAAP